MQAGGALVGMKRFRKEGIVIPNAVDTACFFPGRPEVRAVSRRSLGLAEESLILVSVARMEPVKNHRFLLELASILAEHGYKFDLLLVGDGTLRRDLETEVLRRGLVNSIHFLGARGDVADILRCCDALLLPSIREGLPVSLVEAQATGLPCLVADSVAEEADMGLGLVQFLSTDSSELWMQALDALPRAPLTSSVIQERMSENGYTVEGALQALLGLYPQVDGAVGPK